MVDLVAPSCIGDLEKNLFEILNKIPEENIIKSKNINDSLTKRIKDKNITSGTRIAITSSDEGVKIIVGEYKGILEGDCIRISKAQEINIQKLMENPGKITSKNIDYDVHVSNKDDTVYTLNMNTSVNIQKAIGEYNVKIKQILDNY